MITNVAIATNVPISSTTACPTVSTPCTLIQRMAWSGIFTSSARIHGGNFDMTGSLGLLSIAFSDATVAGVSATI